MKALWHRHCFLFLEKILYGVKEDVCDEDSHRIEPFFIEFGEIQQVLVLQIWHPNF